MDSVHQILSFIQHSISLVGVMVIAIGVLITVLQFLYSLIKNKSEKHNNYINIIRLRLGRILTLGLEFIIAADLIGTTTTPDYYSVGILAIVVIIRTVLSFTLNHELQSLAKQQ